jgi:hypothetical protein
VRGRTLTVPELNRATLARQLLLERRRLPVVRALERLAGLQAQWAPAPYVGLWTRLERFRRESLERALLREQAVRAVLMRGTVHLVSRGDYGLFGSAVALPSWVRPESAELAARVHDSLLEFGREPRTRAEVLAWLRDTHGIEHDGGAGLWYALRTVGRLTHAPGSGAWKQPAETRYVLIDHEQVDLLPARKRLVHRYLGAFGPASAADLQTWSGVGGMKAVLGGMRDRLAVFADERGRELFDLADAPRPGADVSAPVRYLPEFDNLVLAYDDRTRVLADEHRPLVTTKNLRVRATFLVDGVVGGTWTLGVKRKVATVQLQPFATLAKGAVRALTAEGEALARFAEPDAREHAVVVAA